MGIGEWLRGPFRGPGAGPAVAELELLRAVLRPERDPDRARLFSQVGPESKLRRELGRDTFSLSLDHTAAALADLDQPVRTPWFAVHDAETGQRLEFRVEIRAGGFFGALEGRVREGDWPASWAADPADLQDVPILQLPERDEQAIARVAQWLGQEEALLVRAGVVARPPAKAAALAALAASNPALPDHYRDFLQVTDGLQVGPIELLGAQDVYVVEVFGGEHWVVGALPDAAFVIAATGTTAVYTVEHDERDLSRAALAPSLTSFIAGWVSRIAD